MLDPTAWRHGVKLFEAGAYWHAHEALEAAWLKAVGLERHFLGGVILLAAALHKAHAQANARGGRRNYAKALAHLALVPDVYYGVNVRQLESSVLTALRDPRARPCIPTADEESS